MLVKTIIVVWLLVVVAVLLGGGVFLVKDRSDSRRVFRSLALRVALSVSLVAFILLSYWMGWIRPHPPYQGAAPAVSQPR